MRIKRFPVFIVRPFERGIVELLGRYRKFIGPGLHFIFPILGRRFSLTNKGRMDVGILLPIGTYLISCSIFLTQKIRNNFCRQGRNTHATATDVPLSDDNSAQKGLAPNERALQFFPLRSVMD